MDIILNKRVIFVAGKGGAGKTTVTAALAMAAASHDKNVLVVETNENEALSSLFGETGLLKNHPGSTQAYGECE
jgi:arsenite/tail-anchored protein-transporting ATPase